MTYSFSGPSFLGLYPALVGAIFVGAVYNALAKTNGLPILVLMVREVADYTFYKMISASNRTSDPRSQAKICATTNLMVNMATLFALHRLQLISQIGMGIFASLMAVEIACKCSDFSKYRPIL